MLLLTYSSGITPPPFSVGPTCVRAPLVTMYAVTRVAQKDPFPAIIAGLAANGVHIRSISSILHMMYIGRMNNRE